MKNSSRSSTSQSYRGRPPWPRRLLLAFAALACGVFLTPANAITPSTTTVTASANPVAANTPVTLRATVEPSYTNLTVDFPLTFGASAGAGRYFTYTLVGGVFGATLSSANLTDATTPGGFGVVNVLSGGNAGETSIQFEVIAGAGGLALGDTIRFAIPAIANTVAGVVPTIGYVLGDTPFDTISSVPQTSVAAFTPGGAPTGTVDFQVGGVSITGCGAVALANLAAQCTSIFASVGTKVITAVYSGNATNFTSTGSLSPSLSVALQILPATTSNGQIGKSYSVTFTASGGTAPYAFAASSAALPPGLAISSGGVLNGTPTTPGTYIFTVTGIDNTSIIGQRTYTLVIAAATQTITFTLPATSTTGSAFALNGVASSGLPVSYSVTTPATCSVSGSTLSLLAKGSCTVVASQQGDSNNNAATPVTRSMLITAGGGLVLRSADAQMLTGQFVSNQLQFVPHADPGINFRLLALADINGNGINDLVYQDITQGEFGDVHVWADFQSANDRILRNVKLAWDVQAVGDMDGDGFGDLVFRYNVADSPDTGVSYIWFTDGNAVTKVRKRGGAPLTWKLLGAADLNGDRAADVVYISPANQVRILMATSSRTCANLTAGTVLSGYTALKLADFTGARRGDVLIRNATTGDVRLITLDARFIGLPVYSGNPDDPNAPCTPTSQSITALTYPAIASDPSWQYYAAVDLNGDGIADIIWLKPDGSLAIWLMTASNGAPTIIGNAGTAPVGFSVFQP